MKTISALLIIVLTSCSSLKKTQKEPLLYLGKTACLGKCPVYDLYIFENGKVEYQGIKNVEKLGKHSSQLTTDQIKKLKKELSQINIKNDEKLKRDIPNTILRFNGKLLRIQNTKQIKGLEILIQKIVS